jgi:hypothetical protein
VIPLEDARFKIGKSESTAILKRGKVFHCNIFKTLKASCVSMTFN